MSGPWGMSGASVMAFGSLGSCIQAYTSGYEMVQHGSAMPEGPPSAARLSPLALKQVLTTGPWRPYLFQWVMWRLLKQVLTDQREVGRNPGFRPLGGSQKSNEIRCRQIALCGDFRTTHAPRPLGRFQY